MAAFPQSWLEELHARNDIVEVIGTYVVLTPKGGRHWGLCPFHGEKTASFSVSADKQLYYCFGCHVGGDVIHFVRTMEKISYMEAIQMLANRANLALPETIDDREMQRDRDRRERMHRINREAAHYFHQSLLSTEGRGALAYLQKRGTAPETVKVFGLGYGSAEGRRLGDYLIGKGHNKEDLLALGLIKERNDRYYDVFRDRVIFPIIARNKQVIGFGGRILGEGQPKYLNSPESAVFSKRRNLYGLHLLRGKSPEALLLVEGYMDVISLYQAGVEGAVATLGTALTQQQARLIKSYSPKVYLAYDGDTAGQNATLKAIDILQKEGIEARILRFPEGQDPDDFVRNNGKSGLDKLCADALASNAYKLERIKVQFDLTTTQGKENYAKEGSLFIQRLSPVEQERYFAQLSRETDYNIETLRKEGAQLGRNADKTQTKQPPTAVGQISSPTIPAGISKSRLQQEKVLIAAAAAQVEVRRQILPHKSLFAVPAYLAFLEAVETMPSASVPTLLANLPPETVVFLGSAVNSDLGVYDPIEVESGLQRLWRLQLQEEIERLRMESDAESTMVSRRIECTKRIKELNDLLDNAEKSMQDEED